jgi:hypothetical protein
MALTGVTDLSVITDLLLGIIRTAMNAAVLPFPFDVTGAMPESVRSDGGCQVCFYLYQVGVDRNVRNTPVTGPQLSRQRPLGLELYYLLTVYAGKEFRQEQHATAIAMRALQDNPILRLSLTSEEMTVSTEMEGFDKLGILWQAASAPFRLTVVYRVAVAFLAPTDAAPVAAPKPTAFSLTAQPSDLPFAGSGQLLGTHARITYLKPDSTPAALKTGTFDLSPATVAPGQRVVILGAGFTPATQFFLLDADGTNERDISTWRAAAPVIHTETAVTLELRSTVGTPPADSPAPGIYQVRAGSGAMRTNSVALSVCAAVTGVTNPPVLAAAAGLYTFSGVGFTAGRTEVLLETVALNESAGALGAGEFQILGGGTSIAFRAPAALGPGRYGVRVRVSGVESAPSWWVTI